MTVPHLHRPVHAFTNDVLASHDGTALAQLIRTGELSVAEVTEAAINRARQVEPAVHGLAAEAFGPALAAAKKAIGSGAFAGVPTLIKDNTDVAGLPTGHGSAAVPPTPAGKTSPFARQMLAQGFVCLGKSTLPEFGFNATTEPAGGPATRNPWNLAYSTGASSGGSAALVAAGVVPIAHANDGGGSIRIPAACCGLVGLKPSRGRLVDNEAARALPVNIVSEGIVSRSVRDTANFFAAAESFYRNPKLPPVGQHIRPADRSMRIGLVVDSINGHRTDAVTRAAVEETARRLESLGHRIEPIDVPVKPSFADDFALYWGMLAFALKTGGRKLLHPQFDKHRVDGLTHGLDRMFRSRLVHVPAAIWRLKRSCHDYAHAMAGFDAVLTPVLGHTTPELGYLSPELPFDTLFDRLTRYVSFTPLANATGAPAIALPASHTGHGLPVSVQLMGRHGGERTLLELAFSLEQSWPWPTVASYTREGQEPAVRAS